MVNNIFKKDDARYLVRFDDICPTMNWAVWNAIETHLVAHQVLPILAVVPDNQDANLVVDPPRENFWDQVRRWQQQGYCIALHGYQHRYVNKNPGILRLTNNSEFAGLPRTEQKDKLSRGIEIFSKKGVRVDAWVAPSHSFDRVTVEVLAELGVTVISDGLQRLPFTDSRGVTWIPQQLWNFALRSAGVWTVCYHHNKWTDQQIEEFKNNLDQYDGKMTDVATVIEQYSGRKASVVDWWQAFSDWAWNHYLVPIRTRVQPLKRVCLSLWRK